MPIYSGKATGSSSGSGTTSGGFKIFDLMFNQTTGQALPEGEVRPAIFSNKQAMKTYFQTKPTEFERFKASGKVCEIGTIDGSGNPLTINNEAYAYVNGETDPYVNVVGGLVGARGEIGPKGNDGKDGTNGKDGADGKDGKDGAPGANGKDGKDGAPGADGKDGARGPQGPKGDTGSGSTITVDNELTSEIISGTGLTSTKDPQSGAITLDVTGGAVSPIPESITSNKTYTTVEELLKHTVKVIDTVSSSITITLNVPMNELDNAEEAGFTLMSPISRGESVTIVDNTNQASPVTTQVPPGSSVAYLYDKTAHKFSVNHSSGYYTLAVSDYADFSSPFWTIKGNRVVLVASGTLSNLHSDVDGKTASCTVKIVSVDGSLNETHDRCLQTVTLTSSDPALNGRSFIRSAAKVRDIPNAKFIPLGSGSSTSLSIFPINYDQDSGQALPQGTTRPAIFNTKEKMIEYFETTHTDELSKLVASSGDVVQIGTYDSSGVPQTISNEAYTYNGSATPKWVNVLGGLVGPQGPAGKDGTAGDVQKVSFVSRQELDTYFAANPTELKRGLTVLLNSSSVTPEGYVDTKTSILQWRGADSPQTYTSTLFVDGSIQAGVSSFALGDAHTISSGGDNIFFRNEATRSSFTYPAQEIGYHGNPSTQFADKAPKGRSYYELETIEPLGSLVDSGEVNYTVSTTNPFSQSILGVEFVIAEAYTGPINYLIIDGTDGKILYRQTFACNAATGERVSFWFDFPVDILTNAIGRFEVIKENGSLLKVRPSSDDNSKPYYLLHRRRFGDFPLAYLSDVEALSNQLDIKNGGKIVLEDESKIDLLGKSSFSIEGVPFFQKDDDKILIGNRTIDEPLTLESSAEEVIFRSASEIKTLANKSDVVNEIVAGDNITINTDDPTKPVISSTGGGGSDPSEGFTLKDDKTILLATGSELTLEETADITGKFTSGNHNIADVSGDTLTIGTDQGDVELTFHSTKTEITTRLGGYEKTLAHKEDVVNSLVAGSNITINTDDPTRPIINATGGGGGGGSDPAEGFQLKDGKQIDLEDTSNINIKGSSSIKVTGTSIIENAADKLIVGNRQFTDPLALETSGAELTLTTPDDVKTVATMDKVVQSLVAGNNITINVDDPAHPVINAANGELDPADIRYTEIDKWGPNMWRGVKDLVDKKGRPAHAADFLMADWGNDGQISLVPLSIKAPDGPQIEFLVDGGKKVRLGQYDNGTYFIVSAVDITVGKMGFTTGYADAILKGMPDPRQGFKLEEDKVIQGTKTDNTTATLVSLEDDVTKIGDYQTHTEIRSDSLLLSSRDKPLWRSPNGDDYLVSQTDLDNKGEGLHDNGSIDNLTDSWKDLATGKWEILSYTDNSELPTSIKQINRKGRLTVFGSYGGREAGQVIFATSNGGTFLQVKESGLWTNEWKRIDNLDKTQTDHIQFHYVNDPVNNNLGAGEYILRNDENEYSRIADFFLYDLENNGEVSSIPLSSVDTNNNSLKVPGMGDKATLERVTGEEGMDYFYKLVVTETVGNIKFVSCTIGYAAQGKDGSDGKDGRVLTISSNNQSLKVDSTDPANIVLTALNGSSIARDMFFGSIKERDAFTQSNPERIFQGVVSAINPGYSGFKYNYDERKGMTGITCTPNYTWYPTYDPNMYITTDGIEKSLYVYRNFNEWITYPTTTEIPLFLCWETKNKWVWYVSSEDKNKLIATNDNAGNKATITLDGGRTANGLEWDGQYIWVIHKESNSLMRYETDGTAVGAEISLSHVESEMKGIAFDGMHFWLGSATSKKIYKFSHEGYYTGESYELEDEMQDLVDLAYDGRYILVACSNKNIYTFEVNGPYNYYQYDDTVKVWRDANLLFQGREGPDGPPGDNIFTVQEKYFDGSLSSKYKVGELEIDASDFAVEVNRPGGADGVVKLTKRNDNKTVLIQSKDAESGNINISEELARTSDYISIVTDDAIASQNPRVVVKGAPNINTNFIVHCSNNYPNANASLHTETPNAIDLSFPSGTSVLMTCNVSGEWVGTPLTTDGITSDRDSYRDGQSNDLINLGSNTNVYVAKGEIKNYHPNIDGKIASLLIESYVHLAERTEVVNNLYKQVYTFFVSNTESYKFERVSDSVAGILAADVIQVYPNADDITIPDVHWEKIANSNGGIPPEGLYELSWLDGQDRVYATEHDAIYVHYVSSKDYYYNLDLGIVKANYPNATDFIDSEITYDPVTKHFKLEVKDPSAYQSAFWFSTGRMPVGTTNNEEQDTFPAAMRKALWLRGETYTVEKADINKHITVQAEPMVTDASGTRTLTITFPKIEDMADIYYIPTHNEPQGKKPHINQFSFSIYLDPTVYNSGHDSKVIFKSADNKMKFDCKSGASHTVSLTIPKSATKAEPFIHTFNMMKPQAGGGSGDYGGYTFETYVHDMWHDEVKPAPPYIYSGEIFNNKTYKFEGLEYQNTDRMYPVTLDTDVVKGQLIWLTHEEVATTFDENGDPIPNDYEFPHAKGINHAGELATGIASTSGSDGDTIISYTSGTFAFENAYALFGDEVEPNAALVPYQRIFVTKSTGRLTSKNTGYCIGWVLEDNKVLLDVDLYNSSVSEIGYGSNGYATQFAGIADTQFTAGQGVIKTEEVSFRNFLFDYDHALSGITLADVNATDDVSVGVKGIFPVPSVLPISDQNAGDVIVLDSETNTLNWPTLAAGGSKIIGWYAGDNTIWIDVDMYNRFRDISRLSTGGGSIGDDITVKNVIGKDNIGTGVSFESLNTEIKAVGKISLSVDTEEILEVNQAGLKTNLPLDMGNQKIANVEDADADTDVPNWVQVKNYVAQHGSGDHDTGINWVGESSGVHGHITYAQADDGTTLTAGELTYGDLTGTKQKAEQNEANITALNGELSSLADTVNDNANAISLGKQELDRDLEFNSVSTLEALGLTDEQIHAKHGDKDEIAKIFKSGTAREDNKYVLRMNMFAGKDLHGFLPNTLGGVLQVISVHSLTHRDPSMSVDYYGNPVDLPPFKEHRVIFEFFDVSGQAWHAFLDADNQFTDFVMSIVPENLDETLAELRSDVDSHDRRIGGNAQNVATLESDVETLNTEITNIKDVLGLPVAKDLESLGLTEQQLNDAEDAQAILRLFRAAKLSESPYYEFITVVPQNNDYYGFLPSSTGGVLYINEFDAGDRGDYTLAQFVDQEGKTYKAFVTLEGNYIDWVEGSGGSDADLRSEFEQYKLTTNATISRLEETIEAFSALLDSAFRQQELTYFNNILTSTMTNVKGEKSSVDVTINSGGGGGGGTVPDTFNVYVGWDHSTAPSAAEILQLGQTGKAAHVTTKDTLVGKQFALSRTLDNQYDYQYTFIAFPKGAVDPDPNKVNYNSFPADWNSHEVAINGMVYIVLTVEDPNNTEETTISLVQG